MTMMTTMMMMMMMMMMVICTISSIQAHFMTPCRVNHLRSAEVVQADQRLTGSLGFEAAMHEFPELGKPILRHTHLE